MKIQNPITFILCFIFLLVNLADSITAHFILPGEANPIYLLTGTILWVYLLKLGMVFGLGFFCLRNKFSSNFVYYMIIVILVFGTMVTSLGVYSNIQGMLHPEIIEEATKISSQEKMDWYFKVMVIIYIIPCFILFGIFFLYDYSYKYVDFDKKYFKERKWWKI